MRASPYVVKRNKRSYTLTPEGERYVLLCISEGKTYRAIAKEVGISTYTISKLYTSQNGKPFRLPDLDLNELVKHAEQGKTGAEIAKIMGHPINSIYHALSKIGVSLRKNKKDVCAQKLNEMIMIEEKKSTE